MSCGKGAETCKRKADSHGQPEATATWAAGRGGGGHCARCGGFLDSGGVCHNPRCGTLTMSLAGGGILGIVDTAEDDEPKGCCPQCGAELSVGDGESDWCLECEELVTAGREESGDPEPPGLDRFIREQRGASYVHVLAGIVERWNTRVIANGWQDSEAGAEAYLKKYGKNIGAPKVKQLAIYAERQECDEFARGMWKKLYALTRKAAR